MAINADDVAALIISVLEGDAILQTMLAATATDKRVYQDEAPRNSRDIYTMVGLNNSDEVTFISNENVMADTEFYIRVVGRNSGYSAIKPIADRIDVIMKTAGNVVYGDSYIGPFVRGAVIKMA